jgi:hypothetical protein
MSPRLVLSSQVLTIKCCNRQRNGWGLLSQVDSDKQDVVIFDALGESAVRDSQLNIVPPGFLSQCLTTNVEHAPGGGRDVVDTS